MNLPNLSGIADPTNVETKGSGRFTAKYINWSRSLQDIRQNAPGWTPEILENFEGSDVWAAPDGSGYLKVRWVHTDGTQTVAIPHAIMDHSMKPIAGKSISSRDIADGFVRGACKAAAAIFGYAWQMWSDDPMSVDQPTPPPEAKITVSEMPILQSSDAPPDVLVPCVKGAEEFEGRHLDSLSMDELMTLAGKAKSEKWKELIAHAMNVLSTPVAETDGWE
jgi:hypothetical protein|tara:strand:- start:8929 stop:9591 length:663 start_codon:yes stop_codon:yes gene_type:complete